MLVGFSFKNYSSYKKDTTLSLVASKKDEFKEFNTFDTEFCTLLKSCFIYGANASGKTNIIKGLNLMKNLVLNSDKEKIVNLFETFKFNVDSHSMPISMEISFILSGCLYEYGFEVFSGKINREWLYRKKERRVKILDRKTSDFSSIKLTAEFSEAEDIKRFVSESALFLTIASRFNIKLADQIIKWFSKMLIIFNQISPQQTLKFIEEDKTFKDIILKYLKRADIGIEDFDIDINEKEINEHLSGINLLFEPNDNMMTGIVKDENGTKLIATKVNTFHSIYDKEFNIVGTVKLPFNDYQSAGTQKLFEILGPIIKTLKDGGVVIIDEIDSKLHCNLVRHLITTFNSIDKNSNNAQLICNTHDVLLLEENIRRDQIWFIQKNEYGESELYPLSDFKNVRKNDDLLKKYLLGFYGAIPFADRK